MRRPIVVPCNAGSSVERDIGIIRPFAVRRADRHIRQSCRAHQVLDEAARQSNRFPHSLAHWRVPPARTRPPGHWLAPDAAAVPLAAASTPPLSAFLHAEPNDRAATPIASSACSHRRFVTNSPVFVACQALRQRLTWPSCRRLCHCPFVSLLASAPGMLVVSVAGFVCDDFL